MSVRNTQSLDDQIKHATRLRDRACSPHEYYRRERILARLIHRLEALTTKEHK